MRYVISGAAGFIGSHLSDSLIEQGHHVIALDNLITGHVQNLKPLLENPAFKFIEQDVCKPFDVSGSMAADDLKPLA